MRSTVRPAGAGGRRAAPASILTAIMLGTLLGMTACGGGGEGSSARPSDRTSAERTAGRPAASAEQEPGGADTATANPTRTEGGGPERPTRPAAPTEAPPPTQAGPAQPVPTQPPPVQPQPTQPPPAQPTQVQPPPATQALPPAQTVTASAAATAASSDSGGLGLFGWIVLIALVAAAIAGPLIWRSRRRSAWDTELDALEADTRTVTATRLPPVLTTETVAQRGLAWAPLRTDLISLLDRWTALAARAPGEERTLRSQLVQRLLQDLIDAVDAENEALATGRDWTLLRPRVNEAERALAAALTPQAQPAYQE